MSLPPTVVAALEAARAAGAIALRYYRDGFDVTLKPDRTPVTQADREAEEAIISILGRAFPDVGFLGEEFGARGSKSRRWIVDPIDGTKNFVRRIPIWAVLIALEEEGEVTTGVIHNPVSGEMLWARRGEGAWLDSVPVRVSDTASLDEALLLHSGLGLLRATPWWDGFLRLVDATERQRGFGDYYGYGLIAQGKGDVYVEVDLKPWDIAAVKILVEEAGGRLTDFEGRPSIYHGTVLATNGRLHEAARRLLAEG